jgi:hypothetical protein
VQWYVDILAVGALLTLHPVKNAGFGPRPTTQTGHSLVDAFVWVKPGGEVSLFQRLLHARRR